MLNRDWKQGVSLPELAESIRKSFEKQAQFDMVELADVSAKMIQYWRLRSEQTEQLLLETLARNRDLSEALDVTRHYLKLLDEDEIDSAMERLETLKKLRKFLAK